MKGADVVVVGGTVGGTSTVPLLAELGASVTLLERETEPAAVGAGIRRSAAHDGGSAIQDGATGKSGRALPLALGVDSDPRP